MLDEKRKIYNDIVIGLKPSCKRLGLGFFFLKIMGKWIGGVSSFIPIIRSHSLKKEGTAFFDSP